jgi:hypothetical protein
VEGCVLPSTLLVSVDVGVADVVSESVVIDALRVVVGPPLVESVIAVVVRNASVEDPELDALVVTVIVSAAVVPVKSLGLVLAVLDEVCSVVVDVDDHVDVSVGESVLASSLEVDSAWNVLGSAANLVV